MFYPSFTENHSLERSIYTTIHRHIRPLQIHLILGGQGGSNISGHTHDFRILHEVDKELRDHYESKLKPLDSRIEELTKREKEIDREFDEITTNCKDMLSEVNKRKDEQVLKFTLYYNIGLVRSGSWSCAVKTSAHSLKILSAAISVEKN